MSLREPRLFAKMQRTLRGGKAPNVICFFLQTAVTFDRSEELRRPSLDFGLVLFVRINFTIKIN